jgi:hypothetical protein
MSSRAGARLQDRQALRHRRVLQDGNICVSAPGSQRLRVLVPRVRVHAGTLRV